ncbi:hypothetical protein [endosymbiont GvMRE of Glomus versiforme]|uniref:hypothetical protein n=1 Tax=endosymbiont GvMRE of Glomus versiforme TaxID=2039283 RepID=UPI000ECBD4EC|nr:hypothetical protein [endosymbiont GvMRE of Glomus versiforme]RHZ36664.1 hypothetical protein GvMRE_I2g393 [endosymbiont GvMRE of Glomus versiforme]
MDKKKLVWTAAALAVTGLVAYVILHNCKKECFICRYSGPFQGIAFLGSGVLGVTFKIVWEV